MPKMFSDLDVQLWEASFPAENTKLRDKRYVQDIVVLRSQADFAEALSDLSFFEMVWGVPHSICFDGNLEALLN
jgi:hypothetical protein